MKKVVMITGASSGMGAEMAKYFASLGFNLAIFARRKDKLQILADEIKSQYKSEVLIVAGDVNIETDVNNLAKTTIEQLGRIDIVVANAGFGVMGKFEDLNQDDFRRQFETNVFGVLSTVRYSLDEIKKNKGSIVILGSGFSYISLPVISAYAMSKFAVRALAESLRFELQESKVAVTLVCPGAIDTEFRKVDRNGVLQQNKAEHVPSFFNKPANQAAKEIVQAVLKRKPEIHITMYSAIGVWFIRHFPGCFRCLVQLTNKQTTKILEKAF